VIEHGQDHEHREHEREDGVAERLIALAVLALPWIGAALLAGVQWTRPSGRSVRVAVVQGSISQNEKWLKENRETTLDLYRNLSSTVFGVPLIVWPEAAPPDLANNLVDYLGGPSGLVEIPPPHPLPLTAGAVTFIGKLAQYWLMLVLFLASAAVLIRLECSRFGLVNGAIRQGELLAETLGVNVPQYKLGAFVLGAFFAGVAGVFFAHSQRVLHSSDFGLEPMVLLVVFTVIGGAGSVWGPVVGTLVLAVASELLRELHYYELLVYGLVLMIVMLCFPDGLVALPGRVARRFGWGRAKDGASTLGAGVAP